MLTRLPLDVQPVPDDPRPWDQIPEVKLFGLVVGLAILVMLIRYLITGRTGKKK